MSFITKYLWQGAAIAVAVALLVLGLAHVDLKLKYSNLQTELETAKAGWAKEIATQATALADEQKRARATEQAIAASEAVLRKDRDERLQNINARLADALGELRDRPSRPPAPKPGSPPAPAAVAQAGTGAGLFREDAEFLEREAASAAAIAAERDYWYEQYAQAQQKLADYSDGLQPAGGQAPP